MNKGGFLGGESFRTTRWSMVVQAGSSSPGSRAALEELCSTYWFPLYALARRQGAKEVDAEDLVQGFLTDLLSRGDLSRADPERGRFRAYLVTAFRHFISNQRKHGRAAKRGGGRVQVELDRSDGERRYQAASGKALNPEALFDRAWARSLLALALERLRADYVQRDQEPRYLALHGCLTGDALDREKLARDLDLSEGSLKVAIHRLRSRYRESVRACVRDTVQDEREVDAELSALLAALGG